MIKEIIEASPWGSVNKNRLTTYFSIQHNFVLWGKKMILERKSMFILPYCINIYKNRINILISARCVVKGADPQ
ncbi:hypothetical protein AGMMS50230_00360 [Spirochaetia bacterium]|nr:hypothetical protein AGMMS50230_00360 [Spirochaetia bacterium]